MRLLSAATFLVSISLSGWAWGCEQALKYNPKPIQNGEDCSFTDFGATGQWSGRPVRDFGDGKVAQLLVASESCPYQEVLHFVDCNSGESASVYGVYEPSIQRAIDNEEVLMLGGDLMIKYIQPPHGPVSISGKSTEKSVSSAAKKAEYEVSSDILSDFREDNQGLLKWFDMGAQYDNMYSRYHRYAKSKRAAREFDPMCGCKIYYPDSVGAKQ